MGPDEGFQNGQHHTHNESSAACQGVMSHHVAEGLVQLGALPLLHVEGCALQGRHRWTR